MKGGLLLLACVLSLAIGCKENEQPAVNGQDQGNVSQSQPPPATIPPPNTPTKTKYKSYPEVIRSLFSEYSTMNEIRDIIGRPEYIQNVDDKTQVWFYGKAEIMFKGRFATEIKNSELFKGYRTIHYLIDSDDYNELRFGRELVHRATQVTTQVETN